MIDQIQTVLVIRVVPRIDFFGKLVGNVEVVHNVFFGHFLYSQKIREGEEMKLFARGNFSEALNQAEDT